MTRVTRLFVLIEGITFIIAALTHFGVLIGGYEHHLGRQGRECDWHCASRRFGIDLDF